MRVLWIMVAAVAVLLAVAVISLVLARPPAPPSVLLS